LRTQAAGGKRAATPGFGWLRSMRNRVASAAIAREERREAERAAAAMPSARERQAELAQFYEHYETLVGLICDAAQLGACEDRQRLYDVERKWMQARYPELRPYVLAYLRFTTEDAEYCLALGRGGVDAFEALMDAETLEELLRRDDGGMIGRIDRTRWALQRYADHLRWLARAE